MSAYDIIEKAVPESILETFDLNDVEHIRLKSEMLVQAASSLSSSDDKYDYLADVTAIDWKDSIEIVYHIYSLSNRLKVALRVKLDRNEAKIESLCSVYRGADFQEREVYDLMGVVFENHPNLKRILLPEEWEGYPLRKDYVIQD